MTEPYYTTSTAFLEALAEAGISYIFANLGSDHPGIIEALAQAKADGRADELPELIICPHETVALSAAHAYAMVTGEPQAVVVHVDSGTQNIGGMVNNAQRGRAPVLVFAGTVPYTQDGELPGSRTEFIQWIQDVRDQRGILRNYVKYDNDVRTGRNVKQLVHRALQISRSEPAGPVYLTGAREVMEESIEPYRVDAGRYPPVAPAALTDEVTAEIATALATARHPLIVTSYLGRDPAAVPSLVALAELMGIPVLEAMAYHVNFPADHPLHAGFQYHSTGQNPVLAEADVILVLDSDVPWIPSVNRPSADAAVYCVDIDPLKSQIQLWDVPARRFAAANSKVAVEQIAAYARDHGLVDDVAAAERRTAAAAGHQRELDRREAAEQPRDDVITPEYLTACVRRLLDGEDALVLTEVVTNSKAVAEHLRAVRPGSVLHHGGGALGWSGGAAVGAKLARPDRTVVSLVGDGSFLFSVPSSAIWVQRRYDAPALTVIYDNGGWQGPKFSTLQVHPAGVAASTGEFPVSLAPFIDLPGVALAAGAGFGATVSDPAELPQVLKDALATVQAGRP
ncbi:MAG TPA: thiamine pyrophosphate-requiring protein, partial [Trebonia sp.]|nr:thiamine pyrophosphate-requiring protein [Trebonia sp.]